MVTGLSTATFDCGHTEEEGTAYVLEYDGERHSFCDTLCLMEAMELLMENESGDSSEATYHESNQPL